MTLRKVLVEFELDPTEYAGMAIEGTTMDSPEPLGTLPDTQEAAEELVKAMFRGEVDICASQLLSGLVLLFRGQASPERTASQLRQSHQEIFSAIINTLQKFHHERPFQALPSELSITAKSPRPNQPYYEVSVWRSPSSLVTSEPPVLDFDHDHDPDYSKDHVGE